MWRRRGRLNIDTSDSISKLLSHVKVDTILIYSGSLHTVLRQKTVRSHEFARLYVKGCFRCFDSMGAYMSKRGLQLFVRSVMAVSYNGGTGWRVCDRHGAPCFRFLHLTEPSREAFQRFLGIFNPLLVGILTL